jgi:hypothetical protein
MTGNYGFYRISISLHYFRCFKKIFIIYLYSHRICSGLSEFTEPSGNSFACQLFYLQEGTKVSPRQNLQIGVTVVLIRIDVDGKPSTLGFRDSQTVGSLSRDGTQIASEATQRTYIILNFESTLGFPE